jgi:hypothetical protein
MATGGYFLEGEADRLPHTTVEVRNVYKYRSVCLRDAGIDLAQGQLDFHLSILSFTAVSDVLSESHTLNLLVNNGTARSDIRNCRERLF